MMHKMLPNQEKVGYCSHKAMVDHNKKRTSICSSNSSVLIIYLISPYAAPNTPQTRSRWSGTHPTKIYVMNNKKSKYGANKDVFR